MGMHCCRHFWGERNSMAKGRAGVSAGRVATANEWVQVEPRKQFKLQVHNSAFGCHLGLEWVLQKLVTVWHQDT
jgi:hypothetical protein